MKLKTVRETPPGGWRYEIERGNGIILPVTGESWRNLVQVTKATMMNNQIPVPEFLEEIIQDWMCQQLPPNYCYYTAGLGDKIAKVIHGATAIVDAVAGTQLQKKTRGCYSCGKRRQAMNGGAQ